MPATVQRRRTRRTGALLCALVIGSAGLAACGDDEPAAPEPSREVEKVRGDDFWADVDRWSGEKIRLTAKVHEVVNDSAFTVAPTGQDGTDPLPVVSAAGTEVSEGETVQVTGVLRDGFRVVDVADDLGLDWDDDLFADWEDEHYLTASAVDPKVGDRGS
ncbi:hypothetical protein [Streptomyces sp. JJ36]|uniref:hypothetical protein n=1 Tax=Streptomyces sp. JJ36 TaxID=2736645 RepID=UPI001F324CD0|nr:hypothetical protein [Streptomyces sp. JJ36]MCF6526047.1 hypothetical protein [Streptomyces sp. JJ36]